MKRKLKIVLIDNNDVFRTSMLDFAASRGLSLKCYRSVLEMGSVSGFANFDVAIVESDLGTLTGIEVGEYLSALIRDMPLILISCGVRPAAGIKKNWPTSIKAFVHKNEGPDAILDSALQFRALAS